jgi:hypothetical protein
LVSPLNCVCVTPSMSISGAVIAGSGVFGRIVYHPRSGTGASMRKTMLQGTASRAQTSFAYSMAARNEPSPASPLFVTITSRPNDLPWIDDSVYAVASNHCQLACPDRVTRASRTGPT